MGFSMIVLGPIYQYGLNLIPAKNHIPPKMSDEITYPFSNFNDATLEVWERMSNLSPHFVKDMISYPCWELGKLC